MLVLLCFTEGEGVGLSSGAPLGAPVLQLQASAYLDGCAMEETCSSPA